MRRRFQFRPEMLAGVSSLCMRSVLVVLAVGQLICVGTPMGVSVVWPEMVSGCEFWACG